MSAIWDTYKYGTENPFYNDAIQKAFYHPSPPRKVDGIARQSSVRSSQKHRHLTAEEESRDYFLDRESNSYLISRIGELGLSPDADSVSFDESWPQSERPSTISVVSDDGTPPSAAPLKGSSVQWNQSVGSQLEDFGEEEKRKNQQTLNSQVSGKTRGKESTLSKYIERFRNSVPMSREQRLQMKMNSDVGGGGGGGEDFWWLQSPSSPQWSRTMDDPLNSNVNNRSVLQGKEQDRMLHDDQQLSRKTQMLQENTNNLIEKMSSMGSSHPAVSTIGLGSDTSGSSATALEEQPYRPAFIRTREPMIRVAPQPRRPEDDILHRWRIQRKREMAKDQVSKFRTELPYYNFSSQRDAIVQTSGRSDERLISYAHPITCPHHHVAPSDNPLLTPPHSHLSCDTQAKGNAFSADLRQIAPTATGGKADGPRQTVLHKAEGHSGDSRTNDGQKTQSQPIEDLDRDLSDENIPEKEFQCPCMRATQNGESTREIVNHKSLTLQRHPEKSEKPLLRQLKVNRKTVVEGHDFNETDVWDTTDVERQAETCTSETVVEKQRDDRQKKRLIEAEDDSGRELKSRSAYANLVELEDEDKRHGMQKKAKERRRRLCAPKNESSPNPSTIRQVINDRMLAASGSLVSSIENFELSSLDLTVTELDEGADDDSSMPAADLGRSSPPVDLESVIYSDGEELAEDDILFNLRQRRFFCLQRLQELDQLILE